MKIRVLIGAVVLGSAVGGYLLAASFVDQRFPSTDATAAELNARPDVLANTRQAFLAEGPDRSVPFRVLFYGQSITEGVWPEKVVAAWGEKYPHLAIDYTNRAIGGFAAPNLKRTIEADLADISPDLVVFHVYGGHEEYRQTVETFGRMTAADVILQTDHATVWPAEKCDIGLFPFPQQLPGCNGAMLREQVGWNEYMSYHFIPSLAEELGYAVEPRLERWTAAMAERNVEPEELLIDDVHLNGAGEQLMAELLVAFVDEQLANEAAPSPARRTIVDVPSPAEDGSVSLTVSDAYRIEAVGAALLPEAGVVSVDGQPVERLQSCYSHGRPSQMTDALIWPAIRQVGTSTQLVEEDWTARLENISADGTSFEFSVEGDQTGFDGTGNSAEDFTSESGRVVIKAEDWMLAKAVAIHNIDVGSELAVRWTTRFLCDDTVEFATPEGVTYIRTLVTGLGDEERSVKLTLPADLLAQVDHFILTPNRAP